MQVMSVIIMSDNVVLEAVLEPKIGVLAAAVGVLDTFFAYKVCLNIKKTRCILSMKCPN